MNHKHELIGVAEITQLSFEETLGFIKDASHAQPGKSKLKGYTLIGIGVGIILSLTALIVYFAIILELRLPRMVYTLIGILVLSGPLVLFVGRGLQLIKPNGLDYIREGKFVLYLREFRYDGVVDPWYYGLINTAETTLGRALRLFGPIMGLGRKDTEVAFGGYRVFIRHDSWREVVYNMARHAGFVVMRFSNTRQMIWELQLCRSTVPGQNFLIYLDKNVNENISCINELNLFEPIAPTTQPRVCIAFTDDWVPFDPNIPRFTNQVLYISLRNFVLQRCCFGRQSEHVDDHSFSSIRRVHFVAFLVIAFGCTSITILMYQTPVWLGVLNAILSMATMGLCMGWVFSTLAYNELAIFKSGYQEVSGHVIAQAKFIYAYTAWTGFCALGAFAAVMTGSDFEMPWQFWMFLTIATIIVQLAFVLVIGKAVYAYRKQTSEFYRSCATG
jgi:hypothetical protein